MARRMTAVAFLGAVGLVAVAGRPAGAAAVPLSSLGGATVQTLMDLGGDGVTAGGERYFDFTYFPSAGAPAADDVRVQGLPAGTDADDLRFVSTWVAAGGGFVSSTVSYDVAPVDAADQIDQISLLANGTAPVPAAATFATASAYATTPTGTAAAPVLSTYDDGRTTPVDTTEPDTDTASATLTEPASQLSVTDTLTVVASTGGLATASVVQNGFTLVTTAVPEPGVLSTIGLAAAGLGSRRRDRKAK